MRNSKQGIAKHTCFTRSKKQAPIIIQGPFSLLSQIKFVTAFNSFIVAEETLDIFYFEAFRGDGFFFSKFNFVHTSVPISELYF